MVQAWETRVDNITRRRAAAKEKKTAKAEGRVVENDVVICRILEEDYDATFYMAVQDDNARPLCWLHFKRDGCSNRRCKWSHAHSIFSGQEEDGEAPSTEPALECHSGVSAQLWPARRKSVAPPKSYGRLAPLPRSIILDMLSMVDASAVCALSTSCRLFREAALDSPHANDLRRAALPSLCAQRQKRLLRSAARLRYVTSKGKLAHDHKHLAVFKAFFENKKATVHEHEEAGVEVVTNKGSSKVAELPERVAALILAASTDADAGALVLSCRHLRSLSRADGNFRGRRREGIARLATASKKKGGSKAKAKPPEKKAHRMKYCTRGGH